MQLESGFEKIRIARRGPNQEKVNRFLRWVEDQGFIVWDLYGDTRYEIDGISKKTQQEIQYWLESLGRTFKKPRQAPRAILCKGQECFNESDSGSLYCASCSRRNNRSRQRK